MLDVVEEGVDYDLNTLVSVYLRLRDAIEQKQEQQKLEIKTLTDQFETVSTALLKMCNEQNVNSIRTPVGTISRRVSTRYWTSDWDSMYQFIKKHDAAFLLEQRIHTTNMREFLENNPDECPIGLQADHNYTVQVRKPNKV